MAKNQAPETVRLVDPRGNTVTVAADKADARLAAGYTKPSTKKAASPAADDTSK